MRGRRRDFPEREAWREGRRGRWRSLIAGVLAFFLCSTAFPQTSPQFVERDDAELLLLEVRLGRETLSDAVAAWPLGTGVLLPIGHLAELLDLAVEVNVATGVARGFVIEEQRTFFIDARAGTAVIGGDQSSFAPQLVEVHQDDIYADAALLSRWWPVDFRVDLYAAMVVVNPREPLPVQRRKERAMRGRAAEAGDSAGPPLQPTPYSWFDGPFADFNIRTSWSDAAEGEDVRWDASGFASADIARLQGELFWTAASEGESTARGTLGRRDPFGGLLGPLRAREALAGQVFDPGMNLIARSAAGDGFLVSNFPLDMQDEFDRHSFRGDAPPGWDVELYQNNTLIRFQRVGPDGRFEFADVPVLFGLNLFKLVFYGPQGQRREETVTFNVGESLVPRGSMRYRLVGADPEFDSRRGAIRLDYGVRDALSASFAAAQVDYDGKERRYVKAGAFGYTGRYLAYADAAFEIGGGPAAEVGVQTRLGSLGLSFSHTETRDYRSEELRPLLGTLEARTEVSLNGLWAGPRGLSFPLVLDLTLDRAEEGGGTLRANATTGTNIGMVALTNRISALSFFVDGFAESDTVSGNLLVGRPVFDLSVRGEAAYQISPELDLTGVAIAVDKRLPQDLLLSAAAFYDTTRDRSTFQIAASRFRGPFGFALRGATTSDGEAAVGADLTFSVGAATSWHIDARPMAGLGVVEVEVFLDRDADGLRDPDEEPIPDVAFFVNKSMARQRTDRRGLALITSLVPYRPAPVEIAASTLGDPLLIPTREGAQVIPRPGKPIRVVFPVVATGEVTGTARIDRAGRSQEAGGVTIELVDASGNVTAKTRTAFDGFYDFTRVPPGAYDVRISGEQAARLGFAAPAPKKIVIGPDGSIIDGIDFLLEAP